MRGTSRGSEERRRRAPLQRLLSRAMVFRDEPQHSKLRRKTIAGFRPDAIRRLQPYIRQAVDDLLGGITADTAPGQPFDFISRFARPLPARVVLKLLGLDGHDDQRLMAWCSGLAQFLERIAPTPEETERAQLSVAAMAGYFEETLAHGPDRSDLLSLLVEDDGAVLSREEQLAQCVMFLFAGYETTRHLLGTSVYWLLRHPDAWSRLRSEPALVRAAVRELLRWDSPIQYTGRRVTTDISMFGQQLRRGDLVLAMIGAANRDPAVYPEPNDLRFDRPARMPLSFGAGPHVCIGAALTLAEVETAIAALLQRWPQLSLAGAEPEWMPSALYRGLVGLAVMG